MVTSLLLHINSSAGCAIMTSVGENNDLLRSLRCKPLVLVVHADALPRLGTKMDVDGMLKWD